MPELHSHLCALRWMPNCCDKGLKGTASPASVPLFWCLCVQVPAAGQVLHQKHQHVLYKGVALWLPGRLPSHSALLCPPFAPVAAVFPGVIRSSGFAICTCMLHADHEPQHPGRILECLLERCRGIGGLERPCGSSPACFVWLGRGIRSPQQPHPASCGCSRVSILS